MTSTTWTFDERLSRDRRPAWTTATRWWATRWAAGWRCRPRCGARALRRAGAGGRDGRNRGRRRAPTRRAADEELADWIEAHTIEEFVERWEAQPVFASQSPELVERAARRAACRHDPRGSRSSCAAPARARSSRSGTSWRRSTARCSRVAGELDTTLRGRRLPDRRAREARRGRGSCPDAGHAPQLERPDEFARAPTRVPRRALRPARALARRSTPRPGPARHGEQAVARAAGARARVGVEQLQRRQAAGERAAARRPPAGARPRSPGPVERARQERRRCRARRAVAERLARGAEAAAAARASRSRRRSASGSAAARTSSARGHRLVGGDRGRHALRAPRPAPRASRRAAPRTGGRTARGCGCAAIGLVHRPGAVGVDPQRRPRADRLAHGAPRAPRRPAARPSA